jgi:hypothetical protein
MLSVKAELHSLWLAADYLANMDAGLGRCRRLHLRFARSAHSALADSWQAKPDLASGQAARGSAAASLRRAR